MKNLCLMLAGAVIGALLEIGVVLVLMVSVVVFSLLLLFSPFILLFVSLKDGVDWFRHRFDEES